MQTTPWPLRSSSTEFNIDADAADLEGGEVFPIGAGTVDVTAGGFVGGLQAGYNFMASENFLLGVEADIQGSAINGEITASITDPVNQGLLTAGTSLHRYGTVRGRAGYPQDRFFAHVTGDPGSSQTLSKRCEQREFRSSREDGSWAASSPCRQCVKC